MCYVCGAWVLTWVCIHICIWRPEEDTCCLPLSFSSILLWDRASQKLTILARVPYGIRDSQAHMTTPGFLHWCQGFELKLPNLHRDWTLVLFKTSKRSWDWRYDSVVKSTHCASGHPDLVYSTHMVAHTIWNYSFWNSNSLFWPLWCMHVACMWCTYICKQNKSKQIFKKQKY